MSEGQITISFGILKEGCSKIVPCVSWELEESDLGLFIIRTEEKLSNFDKVLVQRYDGSIWESNIRIAPENNLELPFGDTNDNIYISSKAIKEVHIPFGGGFYDIILISKGVEIARSILNIQETRNQEDIDRNIKEIYPSEDFFHKDEISVDIDLENPNIGTSFQMENQHEGAEEIIEEAIIEECSIVAKSTKTNLIESLSKIAPVSISFKPKERHNIKDYSKFDIVTEKTGESYITVLHSFFGRSSYFLHNQERIVHWEESFDSYMNWLKSILIKKYNLQAQELDTLKILVICDEEELKIGQLSENITIILRNSAIESIRSKYSQIVDINNKCSIYIDCNENTLFINFERARFREALDFLEEQPILLIGKTSNELFEEEFLENLNRNREVSVSTLAWEICRKL